MRQSIYAIVAAILHLGNINFVNNDLSGAKVNDDDGSQQSLEYAAELLAMSPKRLQNALLERKVVTTM